ncbi:MULTISPECIES: DUF6274 family protein [unclassified Streptomyces]|uniref:DUF6274 family protein n=1 Tax=unclassified Streptomyces TaxID=2593676 RepID=UPI0027423F2C|nr:MULTISPECIES: DUF6274 family protein [unclassified Streptomyces]
MATSARHETRALLRAHLAAASSYRHLTRHCPICHHLLRLAMDGSPGASSLRIDTDAPDTAQGAPEEALEVLEAVWEDEQPSTA